jgi:hypothetical protein
MRLVDRGWWLSLRHGPYRQSSPQSISFKLQGILDEQSVARVIGKGAQRCGTWCGFRNRKFGAVRRRGDKNFNRPATQSYLPRLKKEGLKDADARHFMYAVQNGCDRFVTNDHHFLKDRRPRLEALGRGMLIRRPSDLVAELGL